MNLKHIKHLGLAVAVAAVALGAGCHNSTPTASGSEFQVVITASLANTALQPTINQAQLIFDGSSVINPSYVPATSVANLDVSGEAAAGPHTMAMAIVAQTVSPTNYTVPAPNIAIYDLNNNLIKNLQLPAQSASLATGGAINYTFTLSN